MKNPIRLTAGLFGAAALLGGAAVAAMAATITTPGPLVEIEITPDLNCHVRYLGDAAPSFYSATACGTFAAVDGILYGPASVPAGSNASPRTSWSPVGQSNGGSGTAADPHWISTDVAGGVLALNQRDLYVEGENSYRSIVSVENTSDAAVTVTLYHAADCYLQDLDYGYGEHNPATGAIACRAPDAEGNHSAAGRIEEFVPLTGGSNYYYSGYSAVWAAVGSQNPFPDLVESPDTLRDNGMGLSWTITLPAGASEQIGLLTNFSPLGDASLATTLTAEPTSIPVGGTSTLTAQVTNPNPSAHELTSLQVSLPAQVDYVPASAVGLPEPTVSADGRTLTFAGPINLDPDEALGFTFEVTGVVAGSSILQLSGSASSGTPVVSSSATITVTGGDDPNPPEPRPGSLELPNVIQAVCLAPEQPSTPQVVLPPDTSDVSYTLEGEVVPGATVTVVATANAGSLLPETAEGWTINVNRDRATMTVELSEIDCPIVSVAPEKPTIVQATCEAAPKVTLPRTTGVSYAGVPAKLEPGSSFTLTAIPATGYTLAETAGWTMLEDGTATISVTLDAAPTGCMPEKKDLATTGADPATPWLVIGSVVLVGAGASWLTYRRFRGI